MRLALSRPSRDRDEARAVFAAARRHGFAGVQAKPSQYQDHLGDPAAFSRCYGADAGLAVGGLICYWDRDHRRWGERMGALAPFASAVGSEQICLCANVPRPAGAPPWTDLAASLAEAGRIAADHGCRLSLHNHAGTCFETLADLGSLRDHLGTAPCGLTFDTAHARKGGVADLPAAITELSPYLDNIHLKDVDAAGHFCPLGRGTLDLGALAGAIHSSGYDGWLTVDEESRDVGLDEAVTTAVTTLATLGLRPPSATAAGAG